MYSPGALNVAVVTALPPSTGGVGLLNLTSPGPRCTFQLTVSPCRRPRPPGVPRRAGVGPFDPGSGGRPSSLTQTPSESGCDTTADRLVATPAGPCADWPVASSFTTGGVLPG